MPRTPLPARPSDLGNTAAQPTLFADSRVATLGGGLGAPASTLSPFGPSERCPSGRPVAGADPSTATLPAVARSRPSSHPSGPPHPWPAHAAPLRTCCARPPPFSRASLSPAAPPPPGACLRHRADLPRPGIRASRVGARRRAGSCDRRGRGPHRKGRASVTAAAAAPGRCGPGRADLRPRAAGAGASQPLQRSGARDGGGPFAGRAGRGERPGRAVGAEVAAPLGGGKGRRGGVRGRAFSRDAPPAPLPGRCSRPRLPAAGAPHAPAGRPDGSLGRAVLGVCSREGPWPRPPRVY